jgi:hypothetical protein
MTDSLPRTSVIQLPDHWDRQADPATWPWLELTPLSPFVLADGSGQQAQQQTTIRLCHDGKRLYAHFACLDNEIWGTYTQRDDPLFDEEVVEIFLAPGDDTPIRYAEIEISPNAVLLDALIDNPTGDRADMTADFEWDCPEIAWQTERDDAQGQWWALIVVPLTGLLQLDNASANALAEPPATIPSRWRANFYRIERPRDGDPEFSCWSSTQTEPADFHKPARFGVLDLAGLD